MPRFDPAKASKLVSQLRNSVGRLNALSKVDETVFLADPDKIGSAKYHFIVAIESCIDLCNHVISKNGYRLPEDYADTFAVMHEAGVFEKQFADDLRSMAKFRNRLVHLYWEVDDRKLHAILKTRRDDFKRFLDAISKFLGWAGEGK